MNAVIPDHAVTEPKIELDVCGRLVVQVPNHKFPTLPLHRSYDLSRIEIVDLAKQLFMLGEIHARRCALEDAMREEESASQSFEHLSEEAF